MNKWVLIMADFCSDGFWYEDGSMMSREDLPISTELMQRHIKWCESFERNEVDVEIFAKEGSEIAFAVKDELPDWTVMYYNLMLTKKYPDGPRHMFEYEIGIEQ
jgi:hypothetical protein